MVRQSAHSLEHICTILLENSGICSATCESHTVTVCPYYVRRFLEDAVDVSSVYAPGHIDIPKICLVYSEICGVSRLAECKYAIFIPAYVRLRTSHKDPGHTSQFMCDVIDSTYAVFIRLMVRPASGTPLLDASGTEHSDSHNRCKVCIGFTRNCEVPVVILAQMM